MRYGYLLYLLLIISAVLNSCRSSRVAFSPGQPEPNAAAYIEQFKDMAISEMKRTGVPASITLAQGMIESDFGRSRLATEANNHFGIKCHDDWKGPTIRHNDDRRNECFRKYRRVEESFYDHSDFLRSGSRYSFLFELRTDDYKGWARGLKQAGYATNPDYANMLIRKIEENSLYNYDKPGYSVKISSKTETDSTTGRPGKTELPLSKEPVVNNLTELPSPGNRIMENNRIQYIIVKDGETKAILEERFRLLKWELARYNELDDEFVPSAGQLLYLQPKRDRAEPGKEQHTVTEGETMYSISQAYGIKLRALYEYNRMTEGEEPMPGTKVWLRSYKPVR
jgi:LysM repeat protein